MSIRCPSCKSAIGDDEQTCFSCGREVSWFTRLFGQRVYCDHMSDCALYPQIKNHDQLKMQIALYCNHAYDRCERKKLSDQQMPVQDTLLPNGTLLSDLVETNEEDSQNTQKTVLIVDDSPLAIRVMRDYFESIGYVVQEAYVPNVSRVIREQQPDIVLMDIEFEGTTLKYPGAFAVKTIKTMGVSPNTTYILYSSKTSETLKSLAAEYNADGFVSKMDSFELQKQQLADFI